MSILFSGDFHANEINELSYISRETLVGKYSREEYSGIAWHVILGDGGFLWPHKQKTDEANFMALSKRPFPVLCIVGNHEPILGRNDIPEVDLGLGETVYQIHDKPLVAYLKRGKVYTIGGFKFLVLGGALSIDKGWRKPSVSWWAKEYWSEEEKEDLFALLEKEHDFDYVLAHTGPNTVNVELFGDIMPGSPKFKDEVAILNDEIDSRINCRGWWCGHWHKDRYFYDEDRQRGYQYLYKGTNIL
ncbi:metallophosphoesterase [Leadbettera azotonutricia]|uniref:Ser/Thr protein phosphatase family protein n=1 Tax=Leadbettera azotonutricia (strain ATCC BAA-888 / DSM 13862 / ZAS-9) TaxID=545695 RepID=F5Y736_LEAAZ|nr:metallophosphoesterase [Leadbettera azotonutricia]AEF81158.1 Ser/Thr protein phosphatase family protein [Leadbettera azotonutricia ZAS-9]